MIRRLSVILGVLACLCVSASSIASPALAEAVTLPTSVAATGFSIAQSGRIGAGFCRDGQLRIWALPEGQLLHCIELGTTNFLWMSFSRDGRLLQTSTWGGEVVGWDTRTGKPVFQFRLPKYASAAAFSRDDQYLAVAAFGGRVQVFELAGKTKRCELDAVTGGTQAVVFSPDGALIATADSDTRVRVYDSRTGKLIASNGDFVLEPLTLDFTADSKQVVAAGADKVAVLLDAVTGRVAKKLRKQTEPVGYMEVSGDGKSLATVLFNATSGAQAAPVLIWETGSGRQRSEWLPPSGIVGSAWTSDGHFLAATTTAEAVHIWRVY